MVCVHSLSAPVLSSGSMLRKYFLSPSSYPSILVFLVAIKKSIH